MHNKGFVVDSKTVVISSQNFSPSGVETNRDAGVIIEHPGIAQYFEKVFLSDLKNRSKPFVAKGPKSAPSGAGKRAAPGKKARAKRAKKAPARGKR